MIILRSIEAIENAEMDVGFKFRGLKKPSAELFNPSHGFFNAEQWLFEKFSQQIREAIGEWRRRETKSGAL
jgi:hypothetical protein